MQFWTPANAVDAGLPRYDRIHTGCYPQIDQKRFRQSEKGSGQQPVNCFVFQGFVLTRVFMKHPD
jgi:hypothetical protein